MGEDFRVGDWLVQPRRDCIQRGEVAVHLKPKAMAVLVRLAGAGGGVVTRDELFESVWPGAVVYDATLTQCVVELRHAFGDCARQPEVIETVPKVGFRLIPPVAPVGANDRAERTAEPRGAEVTDSTSPAKSRVLPLVAAGGLLALVLSLYWAYSRDSMQPARPPEITSVAVLPFTDLSEDGSQGWFAEGLAEELRTGLIRLRGLQVAGGVSSAHFGSDPDDLGAVAKALGVDYLLLGSVRREHERLRVTARLVDAATGFHLWSETFDRPQSDVFDVQAEISESVAVAMSITLGVGELGTAPGGTTSFEAFEMTLRAQELYAAFTEESIMGAIEAVKRAVEIDPEYALAWARLATYSYLAPLAFDEAPPIDFLSRAREALDRAKLLDPNLPALLPVELDLHGARQEWAEVERAMSAAEQAGLALLPEAYFSYGVFLVHVGRVQEAQTWLRHARRLEPLVPWYGSKLGHAYQLNGRFGEALAEHERVWALGTGNRLFQSGDGLLASLAANDPDAIDRWLTRAIDSAGPDRAEPFEMIHSVLGDPEAALAWLRQSFERGEFFDPWIAAFAAYFGDTTLALDALLRSPETYVIWIPVMADARRQPGFEDVVGKLGLPEYWREFTWADFCRPAGPEDFVCE